MNYYSWSEHLKPQSPPTGQRPPTGDIFPPGHTYSNKTESPNIATPSVPMWPFLTQITITNIYLNKEGRILSVSKGRKVRAWFHKVHVTDTSIASGSCDRKSRFIYFSCRDIKHSISERATST